ncbi:MAG: SCP2 sterol-binding domain-containing protein [Pseudomonadota bacterium]
MLADLTRKVENKFQSSDALTRSVKFDLGDDGVVVIQPDETPAVHNNAVDTECTITVSADDLNDMVDGELDAANAFMMGRIQVTGDMAVAVQLSSVMKG